MKLLALVMSATVLLGTAAMRSAAKDPTQPIAKHAGQPLGSGDNSPTNTQILIEPGLRVGPLKLGDPLERALELFPKKDEDQEWEDKCGRTFNWVDEDNNIRGGDLFIRSKKGKVFQIESSTTRFHLAEGIAPLDPPEKIADAYKELRAYVLLTAPVPALGDRPLVFWIDRKRGIAFSFAYYPAKRKRYLYKIIVFEPYKNFCPEDETTSSPKWQEIQPYSLEPPIELSPEPPLN